MPVGVSYGTLVDNVHSIVEADRTKHIYVLFSIDCDRQKIRKMKIKNDVDINYLLEFNAESVIFVSLQNAASIPPTTHLVRILTYMNFDGTQLDGSGPSNNICDVGGNCGGGSANDASSDDNDDINIDDIDLEDTDLQKHWFEKFCKYCEKKGMFIARSVREAEPEPEWRRFNFDQLVDEEDAPAPPFGPGWKIPGRSPYVSPFEVFDQPIKLMCKLIKFKLNQLNSIAN
ncbi:hypothetical protein OROGR_023275 [Orobanche gracilis]